MEKEIRITLLFRNLILMDPCIVDYSVEVPTRCSFVIENLLFQSFLKAQHVSSGRCLGNGWSPYGDINQRLQIQFRAPDGERCAARNMLSLQKTLE